MNAVLPDISFLPSQGRTPPAAGLSLVPAPGDVISEFESVALSLSNGQSPVPLSLQRDGSTAAGALTNNDSDLDAITTGGHSAAIAALVESALRNTPHASSQLNLLADEMISGSRSGMPLDPPSTLKAEIGSFTEVTKESLFLSRASGLAIPVGEPANAQAGTGTQAAEMFAPSVDGESIKANLTADSRSHHGVTPSSEGVILDEHSTSPTVTDGSKTTRVSLGSPGAIPLNSEWSTVSVKQGSAAGTLPANGDVSQENRSATPAAGATADLTLDESSESSEKIAGLNTSGKGARRVDSDSTTLSPSRSQAGRASQGVTGSSSSADAFAQPAPNEAKEQNSTLRNTMVTPPNDARVSDQAARLLSESGVVVETESAKSPETKRGRVQLTPVISPRNSHGDTKSSSPLASQSKYESSIDPEIYYRPSNGRTQQQSTFRPLIEPVPSVGKPSTVLSGLPNSVLPTVAGESPIGPVTAPEAVASTPVTGTTELSHNSSVVRFAVETPQPISVPGRLTVRLDPPELGHVRIDLTRGKTGIVGRMRLDREQVRLVLTRNLGDLHRTLHEAGVRVERLEIVNPTGSREAETIWTSTDTGNNSNANSDRASHGRSDRDPVSDNSGSHSGANGSGNHSRDEQQRAIPQAYHALTAGYVNLVA